MLLMDSSNSIGTDYNVIYDDTMYSKQNVIQV